MSLVSIIIPVYNTSRYLRECLDSIRGQTYANWECICIDDGSTDDSASIVMEYVERDSRFILNESSNHGPANARNQGLSRANGDFITFVDSDDIIHILFLEYFLSLQQKYNADMVVIGYRNFNSIQELSGSIDSNQCMFSDQPLGDILDGNIDVPLMACCKFFTRFLLDNLRMDESMHNYEDTLFGLNILHRCRRLIKSEAEMYFYRSNTQSLTGRTDYAKQLKYVCRNLWRATELEKQSCFSEVQKIRYHGLAGGSLFWILCKNAIVQYGRDGSKQELLKAKRLYFSAKRRGLLLYSKILAPFSFRFFVRGGFELGMAKMFGWLAARIM